MRYRALGKTGEQVSVIGFGAATLGNVYGPVHKGVAEDAVRFAIDSGINLFDVSPYYGLTLAEERLGECLSGLRNQVFLATKCGRDGFEQFDFSAGRVHASINESLLRLRTDHVDLLQAHDVEFADFRQIVEETVPALRAVQKAGKARFVGVTGFHPKMLQAIADMTEVDTVLSYCHYNLLVDDVDESLSRFAAEHRIGLINASPLHMGILTEGGPPPWHPASEAVKETGAAVVRLCREHGTDASAVALRFCLHHPGVASTLVGMGSRAEVERNLAASDTTIPATLLSDIARLVDPVKNLTWPSGRPENNERFASALLSSKSSTYQS